MPNPSDAFWQQLVDQSATEESRMTEYTQRYGEQYAYRLGNAYMQYPWVNPQITVSLVLTDNDDLMPQVAEYAAARMSQIGVSPRDIAERDFIAREAQRSLLSESMQADASGGDLLAQMLDSVRSVEQ